MELKAVHSMLSPSLSEGDSLKTLMYRSAGVPKSAKAPVELYWDHHRYGLSGSQVFAELSENKKQETLLRLNHWSLSLSYYIEKFGLNYGAKMIFLADSTEEKSLYAIFNADEVRHRLMIEPFIQQAPPENLDFHPLLGALALCLEQGEKEAMVFTIQVILEGFGLTHYKALMDSCQSPALQKVFKEILEDEVNHHGMGIALTQKMQFSPQAEKQIIELTSLFVRSLIDAEWVIKSIEIAVDGLSLQQRKKLLEETKWQEQIILRIERLKGLLRKAGCQALLEKLEQKGVFI